MIAYTHLSSNAAPVLKVQQVHMGSTAIYLSSVGDPEHQSITWFVKADRDLLLRAAEAFNAIIAEASAPMRQAAE